MRVLNIGYAKRVRGMVCRSAMLYRNIYYFSSFTCFPIPVPTILEIRTIRFTAIDFTNFHRWDMIHPGGKGCNFDVYTFGV